MKSWIKPLGILVTSVALVAAGAAMSGFASTAHTSVAAPALPSARFAPSNPAIIDDKASDEAILTPIVPCRAVDTRLGGGGLASNTTRSFFVEGTGNFRSQGGPSNGCAIPSSATALAVVIAAVNPTRLGYLKAIPSGTPAPTSSTLNYTNMTTSSGATVTITPHTARGLTIFNLGGRTDVILDITGYYQPQIEAAIAGSGSFFSHSSRVLSVTHTANTGRYSVVVDRPVVGSCAAVVSPLALGNFASAATDINDVVFVQIFHLVGGEARYTDDEFNLVVSC